MESLAEGMAMVKTSGASQAPYADVGDFFRSNDPTPTMHQVACPLLLINALDDPLVGPDLTPYDKIARNPNIALVETTRGGHMGWGGLSQLWGPTFTTSWANTVCCQFLTACTDQKSSTSVLPAVGYHSRL